MEAQIKVGLNADGVTQGTEKIKRSLNDLGLAANKAGKDTSAGMAAIGTGGDAASRKVESATRNMQGQLQRLVASFEGGEKGSRKFYESLANQRGVNIASLKPLLDQLDAAKAKFQEASQASEKASDSFGGLGEAAGLAGRAFAALGVAASLKSFLVMADASTNLASRLSLVTTSTGQLVLLQNELFKVAQSSRVSFVDLAGTYAQLARSTKDLGVSQSSLVGIVNTISQAVTISGASAASAQAALMQLSQGFASGALRGEELNSVMEQTPRLAQAIADGLGVSIGKLREMGKAGELTSELVLGALEKSAASVSSEFGKMALTVEGSTTQAANSALKLVGVLDKITGASGATAAGISRISSGIDGLARDIERISSTNSLSDFFFTAFQNEETLNVELRVTQEELAKINARLAVSPSNIYARSAKAEMEAYIIKIKEAQDRLDRLSGKGAASDAPTDSGDSIRFARSAATEKRRKTTEEDLNNFRLKSSNVPASYVKDMQEIIRLNQEGALVGKEYTKALKDQQDILLKASGATSKAAAGAGAYARAESEASKLLKAANAERMKDGRDAVIMAGLALEKSNDDYQKALEESTKLNDKYIESLNKSADAVEGQLQKLQYEEEALLLSASANITLAEAIAEVEIARLREQQAIEMSFGNEGAVAAIQREIDARRELAQSINSKDAREAAKKGAEQAAAEWRKTADKIEDSITDALMRGFESGKDFVQVLRDTIVNQFKTMVLRPTVSAIVSPVAQSLTGAIGLPGGASSALGTASNLSSLYSAVTGGFTASIAGTISSAGTLFGSTAMTSFAAGMKGATLAAGVAGPTTLGAGGAVGAGASFATAIPYVAAAAAIAAALGLFSKTKRVNGGVSATLGDNSTYQSYDVMRKGGSLLRGPKYSENYSDVNAEVSDALSLQTRAIKASVIDMGKAVGLVANDIATYSTALKFSTEGLSAEAIQQRIDEGIAAFGEGAIDAAFGSALDAYTQTGEDASATLNRLSTSLTLVNTTFEGLGNELLDVGLIGANTASLLIKAFGGTESYATTMSGYYDNFYTSEEKAARLTSKTAEAFAKLGLVMPAINDATRDNYRALIDELAAKDLSIEANAKAYAGALSLQGAMNELAPTFEAVAQAAKAAADALDKRKASLMDSYANDMTLDEAKAALGAGATRNLMSRSVEQARDFITDYINALTTDADVAQIEGLSGAISVVLDDMQRWEDGLLTLAESLVTSTSAAADTAMGALQRAVGAQREVYQAQAEAARNAVSEIKSIFDTLDSSIKTLYGQVDTNQAAQGRAFIDNALGNAKATGYLPDGQALGDAIQAAMSDSSVYATQAEADFAKLSLAGSLTELKDISGVQLSAAERAVKAAEDQLDILDATLDLAQQQLDASNGINTSVMTVADAVANLASALLAKASASASLAGMGATSAPAATQSVSTRYDGTIAEVMKATPANKAEWYGSMSATFSDSAIRTMVEKVAGTQSNSDWEYLKRMASFDVGTNYVPKDMIAQIHEGEAIIPKAYNPAAGGGNTRLEGLVEGLTKEVQRLQSIVNDGNKSNERIASTLDNVTEGGSNMRTVTA